MNKPEPMPLVTLDEHQPEIDICSWCKEHANFLTDENGSFRSECCDALPISVDVDHFLEDR